VVWAPLTTLFKMKEKPEVGDMVEFDVPLGFKDAMEKYIADDLAAAEKKTGKKATTIKLKLKVTATDAGADAITVTVRPVQSTIVCGGIQFIHGFADDATKVTAGVSIVK
jgi:hypothetical protein